MTSPFREAAIAKIADRRYSTVTLAQPASHTILALLFAVIAACVIAFLAYFSVTRKVQVSGVLLPSQGLIRVQSPAGIVADVRAKEGQSVQRGDVLFVLTNERFNPRQGDTDQAVSRLLQTRRASLETERSEQLLQSQQRIRTLEDRLANLKADSERLDQQLSLQQRRVQIASESVKRQAELLTANFVSAASVQDRQAELIDQEQRLSDLQRTKSANVREVASCQSDLADLRLQMQRDREIAARSIAALDQDLTENEAHREIAVRAPHDGTVTSISATAGASVVAGQTLASVLPANSELQAELYAPSRAAGFIKPGMTVLLRYQAYPYQKFGQFLAQVSEVSEGAMQASEFVLPTIAQNGAGTEPVYRIRARLKAQSVIAYGKEQPLKPGMALEASVVLEQRRLYEWILEPLYSVAGRI